MTELKLVHSSTLTPRQELELVDYVNWDDGAFGLASKLGIMSEKMRDGLYRSQTVSDPETYIIKALDGIRRHRQIHRAMTAIGQHSRTLTQAYLLGKRPIYVQNQFGRIAGLVLAIAPDVEELVNACHRLAMASKVKVKEDKKLIMDMRVKATRLYSGACRAFLAALEHEQKQSYSLPEPARPEPLEHVCRASTVYPCPCVG